LVDEIARSHEIVYSVAWSHDGNSLAVGSSAGTIRIFDVSHGHAQRRQEFSSGDRIVFSLTFSRDDRALVVGLGKEQEESSGNIVAIWDLGEGKLERELRGHDGFVYAVAVSSAGVIASAGLDGTLRLWSMSNGRLLAVAHDGQERIHSVAFSEDGAYLATASGPGKVHGNPGPDNTVRLYWLGSTFASPQD
jgi:WD40 repeat protein